MKEDLQKNLMKFNIEKCLSEVFFFLEEAKENDKKIVFLDSCLGWFEQYSLANLAY